MERKKEKWFYLYKYDGDITQHFFRMMTIIFQYFI